MQLNLVTFHLFQVEYKSWDSHTIIENCMEQQMITRRAFLRDWLQGGAAQHAWHSDVLHVLDPGFRSCGADQILKADGDFSQIS